MKPVGKKNTERYKYEWADWKIWLTIDGDITTTKYKSKRTNHVFESSRPMTSWFNWQMDDQQLLVYTIWG